MRNTADNKSPLGLALRVSVGLALAVASCKKSSDPPPAQAGYPTQAPDPRPAVLAASPAAALPAAALPAATPAATLSQPNPLALPCSTDAQCLTHRCNVAAGKCAWPCQTDSDCIPGNTCISPTCLPKLQ
jgi:hypothetical protein